MTVAHSLFWSVLTSNPGRMGRAGLAVRRKTSLRGKKTDDDLKNGLEKKKSDFKKVRS